MTKILSKTLDELVLEIPMDELVIPTIPVKVVVAEAADLVRYASEDKQALLNRGLNEEFIEELTLRAKLLQDKESIWHAKYESALTNTEEWEAKIDEANLLQRELKYDFQFAFRKNENALRKLKNITDGNGNADIMQDMSDYPKLAAEYPGELAAINFDNSKLVRANSLSHELFDLRDKVDGAKNSSKRPEKEMRDRAYTYLKQLMDEIRDYGKYAFWNNEKRQKKYSSEYARLKNQRNNKNKEAAN